MGLARPAPASGGGAAAHRALLTSARHFSSGQCRLPSLSTLSWAPPSSLPTAQPSLSVPVTPSPPLGLSRDHPLHPQHFPAPTCPSAPSAEPSPPPPSSVSPPWHLWPTPGAGRVQSDSSNHTSARSYLPRQGAPQLLLVPPEESSPSARPAVPGTSDGSSNKIHGQRG